MNIENVPIGALKKYQKNPRAISDVAIAKVAKSIELYGFNQPIVTDLKFRICVGTTRYLAAKFLKLKTVPVYKKKFKTESEFIKYNIADNKVNEFTYWDNDLLKEIINNLNDETPSMLVDSLGFSLDELNKLTDYDEEINLISTDENEESNDFELDNDNDDNNDNYDNEKTTSKDYIIINCKIKKDNIENFLKKAEKLQKKFKTSDFSKLIYLMVMDA